MFNFAYFISIELILSTMSHNRHHNTFSLSLYILISLITTMQSYPWQIFILKLWYRHISPKLTWHGITYHVIIQNILHFIIFFKSWSHVLHFCHYMSWQITCHENFYFLFFINKKVLTSFAMMYMFVNQFVWYILMHTSIKDSIQDLMETHQTTKLFHTFINKEENFNFVVFDMKLFRKLKL